MSDTKPSRSEPKPKPITNPTPKQILMSNAALLHAHRELMQNQVLAQVIALAQSQFVRTLTEQRNIDGNTAASHFFKIEGMNEFVNVLRNLGESNYVPKQTITDKLDHQL